MLYYFDMGVRQRLRAAAIQAYLGEGSDALRRRWNRLRGRRGVRFFHQLDDPHSQLMLEPLARLEASGIAVSLTVVPPPAAELDAEPELRARFALRDAAELAQRYALRPLSQRERPAADAVRLAQAVLLSDPQLSAAREVGDALWGDGDVQALAERRGRLADGEVEARLAEGRALLARAGHYQGGSACWEGIWYLGPERLMYLEEDLRLAGVEVPRLLVARHPARRLRAVSGGAAGARLDMYFSFRSPYSYVALDRTIAIAHHHGADLRIKPVLPMVMRGFEVPRNKRLQIARDCAREARRLGVPFGKLCDPLGPGVERCLAIFAGARAHGRETAFASSAARGIWSEALDMADDADLSKVVRRAGLDWSQARRWLDDDGWRDMAEQHRQEMRALGMWGVPSFAVDGYITWGQDRLDRVEERLARG